MRVHPKHVVIVAAALLMLVVTKVIVDGMSPTERQVRERLQAGSRREGNENAHAHGEGNAHGDEQGHKDARVVDATKPHSGEDSLSEARKAAPVVVNAMDVDANGLPADDGEEKEDDLDPQDVDGAQDAQAGLHGTDRDRFKLRLVDKVIDAKRRRGSAPIAKPKKSLIVGIPTVKRPKQSYLLGTLHSLVNGMSETEKERTVLSIYVSELEDAAFVNEVTEKVRLEFPREFETGLIEVFGPDLSFYPPLTGLKEKYGDSEMRIKWRCKQVVDYAFMMDRLYNRADYYLQLEDDVITVSGWVSQVENFIKLQDTCSDNGNSHSPSYTCRRNWIMLHYCQLGAIGILFRNRDMPFVTGFYMLTFEEQPVDWLNDRIIEITDQRRPVRLSPSLFQHMGKISSLPGKVQELLDYTFRDTTQESPSKNPPATVETSLTPYSGFDAATPYVKIGGRFWALAPNAGDFYAIKFKDPLQLNRVIFEPCEGLPSDVFVHANIEAIIGGAGAGKHSLGTFDRGRLDTRPSLSNVKEIRITVEHPQKTWVCIGKIAINS
eukprot:Opistho-2@35048